MCSEHDKNTSYFPIVGCGQVVAKLCSISSVCVISKRRISTKNWVVRSITLKMVA